MAKVVPTKVVPRRPNLLLRGCADDVVDNGKDGADVRNSAGDICDGVQNRPTNVLCQGQLELRAPTLGPQNLRPRPL